MDCRKTLGLGVCLLIGAVGCTRHDTTLPVIPPAQASKAPAAPPAASTAPTVVSADAVPPGAVVKPLDLPKHPPQAATCVAFGDWQAKEADAPELPESAPRRSGNKPARNTNKPSPSIRTTSQPTCRWPSSTWR